MNTDKACLLDITESMRAVVAYMGDRTLEEFIADAMVVDAIQRRLEVMGEAVKQVIPPLIPRIDAIYHALPDPD